MTKLLYFYTDQRGRHRHGYASGLTLEAGFEILTRSVRQGNQLWHAQWIDQASISILLPIEAFDGGPMKEPLKKLQQEWKQILLQP